MWRFRSSSVLKRFFKRNSASDALRWHPNRQNVWSNWNSYWRNAPMPWNRPIRMHRNRNKWVIRRSSLWNKVWRSLPRSCSTTKTRPNKSSKHWKVRPIILTILLRTRFCRFKINMPRKFSQEIKNWKINNSGWWIRSNKCRRCWRTPKNGLRWSLQPCTINIHSRNKLWPRRKIKLRSSRTSWILKKMTRWNIIRA